MGAGAPAGSNWEDSLALTKAEIETKIASIEAALDALHTHKSYQLDTGQGSQRVTRQDIPDLLRLIDHYETKLDRLNHSGTTSVRYVRY